MSKSIDELGTALAVPRVAELELDDGRVGSAECARGSGPRVGERRKRGIRSSAMSVEEAPAVRVAADTRRPFDPCDPCDLRAWNASRYDVEEDVDGMAESTPITRAAVSARPEDGRRTPSME